jgi:lipooligosaccharide transport system permease protein
MMVRCGIAASAVAVVLAFFGETRSWGLLPGILVAIAVGLSFAMPIMAFSINVKLDGAFAGLQRFLIIPLFLFGGAFYPISQLPIAVQWVAKFFPLWHGVVMARDFSIGDVDWVGVTGHTAYIAVWVIVGTWFAVYRLRKRLYP